MPVVLVFVTRRWFLNGWQPDDGLVEKVRLGGCGIRDLTNADRAWVVVSLSALGWTAQDIADRMECSLRLIRNIKAESAAELAIYALYLQKQLLAVSGTCRLEISIARQQLDIQATQIAQLQRQRADLIQQLQLERATALARRSTSTPRKAG
jgi:hypothetical protein